MALTKRVLFVVQLLTLLTSAVPAGSEKAPRTAPVHIIVFSDFECPFCAQLAPSLNELLRAYPDSVRLFFKHSPLPFHRRAPLAHAAAAAAGEQGKFWEMHDRLFANPKQLDKATLLEHARQIGLDMEAFTRALDTANTNAAVERDVAEARALGVTGTPTLFVNGRKLVGSQSFAALKAAVDEALGLPAAPAAGKDAGPAGPVEIDTASMMFRGPARAPVTIVAFSDFQCPYCARALPTLEELSKAYPEQVRIGMKHMPLDFHPDAPLAHEAVEAAGAQGRFWEMHDRLFANQKALKKEDLLQAARELGLEMNRFQTELESHHYKARVDADKAEAARLGLSGTPSFFINGKLIEGARPRADFERLIQAELVKQGVTSAAALPNAETSPEVMYAKGPQDAPVTLMWFTDLQSSLSPKAAALVDEVRQIYPSQIRVVVRHRPLETHPQSELAHEAVLAAGAQGKFWEMHDLLLANQKALTHTDLMAYAAQLKLDPKSFAEALQKRTYRPLVERDLADARRREVRGSPVFFVNGKRIDGLQPLPLFRDLIEPELARAKGSVQ